MLSEFLIPFLMIAIAELGDKTQLTMLTLSAKFDEPYKIFAGGMLAFLLVDGMAVIFGSILASYISISFLQLASGLIFLAFGAAMYLSKDEENQKISAKSAFLSSFMIIFIAELGDKTQIASLVFATQFSPVIVLAAIMLALASVSAIAIVIGAKIKDRIEPKKIRIIASAIFIFFGAFGIYS
ncbi:MAG: TMEM165/GDT1 family protein, partial [Candidatus Aenigmarchaeota archaeon]|nr:TMEM165/GDT1 family protein [Candidatus Aenigmarchaeota archaeon]